MRIAFEDVTPPNWVIADYIMDGLFMIDIVVNFITALETESGELITNRKQIMVAYLKGWFAIDFISCAPITLLFDSMQLGEDTKDKNAQNASRFVKLAKLPRIYRILRVMKMFKLFSSNKALQKWYEEIRLSIELKQIIASLIMMLFLLHIVGSLFAIAGNVSEVFGYTSWLQKGGYSDMDLHHKYITSFYWAAVTISTVGYGDILPQNTIEIFIGLFLIFTGVALYSYIVSKLSTLYS